MHSSLLCFTDDDYARYTAQNLEDHNHEYSLLEDKNNEERYNNEDDTEENDQYNNPYKLWLDNQRPKSYYPPNTVSSSSSSYKNHGDQNITS